jgi:predicted nucleotidyltransferase
MSKTYEEIKPFLPFDGKGMLLLGYRGSLAHGTYLSLETLDDIDILGVTVPPIGYRFGLKNYEQTEKMEGELDMVVYDVRKFMRLLLGSNPNVIMMLWLRENHYLYRHECGHWLIQNRSEFLSKKVYNTFGGYAVGQIHKMESFAHEAHMGAKRKKIVAQYGYDTKNASHAIRILKMGIEILTSGVVNVFRDDAQLYMDIKRGAWTLEQVKAECERLRALLDEAYVRSSLPAEPNYELAESIMVEVHRKVYSEDE